MVRGHYWSVRPLLADRLWPPSLPASVPWSTIVDDPKIGPVRLTGVLHARGDEAALAILIHGLGGSVDSYYVRAAAVEARARGFAVLRLNLRGADGLGEDWYHAGLTSDLAAVVASPSLARFARVGLVGFSLGGHLALRWASEGASPRVVAAVAVCPPLDLAPGQVAIDSPIRRPYRMHVLGGLIEMFEQVAARRPVPISVERARRIRGLGEWDRLVVAPRYGFPSARAYYEEVSVGPHLGAIALPTLVVVGEDDPMIPYSIVKPSLPNASRAVEVHVVPGGHVGFPAWLDLGQPGSRGIDPQLFAWLRRKLAA